MTLVAGYPGDAKVWIYFITSQVLRPNYDSIVHALADLGIVTRDVGVVIISGEEYKEPVEYLKREIGFKELPCLIITYEPLFDEVLKKKKLKEGKVFVLEKGIFTERLIEDNKKVEHFIKGLYNAAKEDDLEGYLRSKKVESLLGMVWSQIKDFVRIRKNVSEVEQ